MSDSNKQAVFEAAQWIVELREEPTKEQLDDFQIWLKSPKNESAWAQIAALDQALQPLSEPALSQISANAIRQSTNVSRRRFLLNFAAISGVGIATVLGIPSGMQQWRIHNAEFATRGGLKQHQLEDGTQLWLNNYSSMDIAFNNIERTLTLHQGEVYISTAKDNRPLTVTTQFNNVKIDAIPLGTEFNLLKRGEQLILSVFEGQVKLTWLEQSVIIDTGQQFALNTSLRGSHQLADQNQQLWRQRSYLADNKTLEQIVVRLEQQFQVHIFVQESQKSRTITGTIPLTSLEHSMQVISATLSISVHTPLPNIVLITEPK